MRAQLDDSLVWGYDQMRKQGLSLEHWWAIYEKVAGLVVVARDFCDIMKCEERWGNVRSQLNKVVAGSRIGARCFSTAQSFVTGATQAAMIMESLAVVAQATSITYEQMHNMFSDLTEKVNSECPAALSTTKRTILCSYKGISLSVVVTHFAEEPCVRFKVVSWAGMGRVKVWGGWARTRSKSALPNITHGRHQVL